MCTTVESVPACSRDRIRVDRASSQDGSGFRRREIHQEDRTGCVEFGRESHDLGELGDGLRERRDPEA
jgi:hypothetical protein